MLPGIPAVGGVAIRSGKAADAAYTVYRGVDEAGVVRYIGITKRNVAERMAEHLKALGSGKEALRFEAIQGTGNLTRNEARIMEQTKINTYGLQKNGGTLVNKINSIALTSPLYQAVSGASNGGGATLSSVLSTLTTALRMLSNIISNMKK
jgi:hypothetical protein